MKILAVSDIELSQLYSASVKERFSCADLIISCGDLSYSYLEYLISMLNIPLYFVHGNHANQVQVTEAGPKRFPDGGFNMDMRVIRHENLLLAGIEGCLQYNYGPFQYSQAEMWMRAFSLVPRLLLNRLRFGRCLDIFITHAPAWKIHDQEDRPHQGIKAFRWIIQSFQPRYHLHGHIHLYRNDTITETRVGKTTVKNVYGYTLLNIDPDGSPLSIGNGKG